MNEIRLTNERRKLNMNNDFAIKSSGRDEWYTPRYAVEAILSYIKPNSTIWCPFDTADSNFVKIFEEEGHKVWATHIDYGSDFFECHAPNCDYIISNPPYSIRNDILIKLFRIGKPFAMLMNTNGLFDSKIRWDLFKNNQFSLIYLQGRVNYMKEYGKVEKSAPPFQSAYISSGITEQQIVFQEVIK
jgi:hypothetical protein